MNADSYFWQWWFSFDVLVAADIKVVAAAVVVLQLTGKQTRHAICVNCVKTQEKYQMYFWLEKQVFFLLFPSLQLITKSYFYLSSLTVAKLQTKPLICLSISHLIQHVTQLLPSNVFCLQNWWLLNSWSCLLTKKSIYILSCDIFFQKLNSWQCMYYIVY